METAVIALLQLPAKIFVYENFDQSRNRIRAINDKLRFFLSDPDYELDDAKYSAEGGG